MTPQTMVEALEARLWDTTPSTADGRAVEHAILAYREALRKLHFQEAAERLEEAAEVVTKDSATAIQTFKTAGALRFSASFLRGIE